MTSRIVIIAGHNPVHVRKLVNTVIGEVVEVDVMVGEGDSYETHISTDHVFNAVEIDRVKASLDLAARESGADAAQKEPTDETVPPLAALAPAAVAAADNGPVPVVDPAPTGSGADPVATGPVAADPAGGPLVGSDGTPTAAIATAPAPALGDDPANPAPVAPAGTDPVADADSAALNPAPAETPATPVAAATDAPAPAATATDTGPVGNADAGSADAGNGSPLPSAAEATIPPLAAPLTPAEASAAANGLT